MQDIKQISTEAIIIGAGPTGLMAACQLARFGVRFIIADSKSGPTAESRAMLVTARSLEIYAQMGLSETAVNRGKPISRFSIFNQGRELFNFRVGDAGKGLTDFPYMQVFEQSKNEELLYEELKKQGLSVLWNTEFISFEQHDGVTVQLRELAGKHQNLTVKARYLIGCDGAGSKVRHLLKCKFKGGTYQNKFFVADTRMKWNQDESRVIAGVSKQNFCAFFPMYGKDNYRVIGTLPKKYQCDENIEFENLETEIKSAIQVPLTFESVNWFSVYKLHYRCVDKFKVGNCFLAGDAAHIHSPAGGQGMNTGLQDAYNLSWKLAMVFQNYAGEKLLDTYHQERYPFAKWLLRFTDTLFSMITSRNVIVSWLRIHLAPFLMRYVFNKSSSGKKLFRIISQIWYNYRKSPISIHRSAQQLRFKAGDRFPYIHIRIDDQLQNCYHLLKEPKFHLIILGESNPAVENELIPTKWKSVTAVVCLPLSKEWELLGVQQKLYILVRPDNYIGWLSDDLDKNTLQQYFNNLC